MISQITKTLINNLNQSPFLNCKQTSDNSGIFQFTGDREQYKITITKVKQG